MGLSIVYLLNSTIKPPVATTAPGFGSEESFEVVTAVVGAVDD